MKIRELKANEIEARVQMIKDTGCSLLLYKDARCDMKILDETFGVMGWKRKHEVIGDNLYCTVSLYDKETNQWIEKQDVGIESYTQKEKGQASDSFKRACFNVGIGRELYTSPFIWIKLDKGETYPNNGRVALSKGINFKVKKIEYNQDREITHLIIEDNNGKQRYSYGSPAPAPEPKIDKDKVDTLVKLIKDTETDSEALLGYYKVKNVADLTLSKWTHAMDKLKERTVSEKEVDEKFSELMKKEMKLLERDYR